MATVLCAWEIGDGHGHVRNLLAVAKILLAAGHRVVFSIPARQVTAIQLIQESYKLPVETIILPTTPSLNQYLALGKIYRAASYLDIMGLHAFDTADRLSPVVERYKILMKEHKIDVVLAECAPCALLAAKIASVPSFGVGTSFGLPEMHQGFDSYPQLDNFPLTSLFDEMHILSSINAVAEIRFDRIADAMAPVANFPFCYPSLDHYGHQRSWSHRAVGPIWKMAPKGQPRQRRGFAYLQEGYPQIKVLISAIRRSKIPFRVFVRNGKYCNGARMEVLKEFSLEKEIADASMILHHGSAGIAQAALSAGRTQICFPYHVENMNNAYRLQMLGVSKAIGSGQTRDFEAFILDDKDSRQDAASVIAAQLEFHSREFPGAQAAAAAIDDIL
jgi:hypothetical protein